MLPFREKNGYFGMESKNGQKELMQLKALVDKLPKKIKIPIKRLKELSEFFLRLPDSFIEANSVVSTPYGRNVLVKTSNLEILLIVWGKQAKSWPHDHNKSEGVMTVKKGSGYVQGVSIKDHQLYPAGKKKFSEGDALEVVKGEMHIIANPDPFRRLITFHAYSPPITAMKVFDPNGDDVFIVTDDCGAWRPRPDQIIKKYKL